MAVPADRSEAGDNEIEAKRILTPSRKDAKEEEEDFTTKTQRY